MIPVVFCWFRNPPLGNSKIFRGLHDAMECAHRFSGSPVYLITDLNPDEVSSKIHIIPLKSLKLDLEYYGHVAAFWKSVGKQGIPWLNVPSVFRWIAIQAARDQGVLPERCFVLDSDMMVFSDLEAALAPFAEYDLLCPQIHNGHRGTTSPILINNASALDDMVSRAKDDIDKNRCFLSDMGHWLVIYESGKYKVGDVGVEHTETQSLFDGNISYNRDDSFRSDMDGYKTLTWFHGAPHFERSSGGFVRLHMLHCWGKYKLRMEDILEKAITQHDTAENLMHNLKYLVSKIGKLAGDLRRPTFTQFATHGLLMRKPLCIVETGCYRGIEGDGMSTVILGLLAQKTDGKLFSIDLSPDHIGQASKLVEKYGLSKSVKLICGDSKEELKREEIKRVDLLYLDSYDYAAENPEPCQQHQLAEIQAVVGKLSKNSAILLDDCIFPDGGKAGLSAPFILSQGWKEVATAYQRLFVRE